MSAQKIDVLAVMNVAAKRLRLGVAGPRTADEMAEARAAVAELIERAEYLCRTGEGLIAFRAALSRIGATP